MWSCNSNVCDQTNTDSSLPSAQTKPSAQPQENQSGRQTFGLKALPLRPNPKETSRTLIQAVSHFGPVERKPSNIQPPFSTSSKLIDHRVPEVYTHCVPVGINLQPSVVLRTPGHDPTLTKHSDGALQQRRSPLLIQNECAAQYLIGLGFVSRRLTTTLCCG